jgi:hypothetical protein
MDQAAEHARIARAYVRFAEAEARGRSPLYEALALGVASDPEIIAFLAALPAEKRQPNLLLAALRRLFGTVTDYGEFRRRFLDNSGAVRSLMLAPSTQTNEPGRCATLLTVLAMLPQPLALLEVGASAGLCLLPDCYGYDYGGRRVPADPPRPIFPCEADSKTPLPRELPEVVWRAGLDLAPIDLADPDQVAWLEALVWPEETDRLDRLRAAMEIAKVRKPRVVKGDLLRDLAALAAAAPNDATLVVFHTAALVYVRSPSDRAKFVRSVRSVCDFWLANEAPGVFPEIAERAGKPGSAGRYLMSVNEHPVAWADFHGASIEWIADPPGPYPAERRQ